MEYDLVFVKDEYPNEVALDTTIEDVKHLKNVCENVGFFQDETSNLLVIRMSLDTSFLEK
jgi:hypothetical protein